jgi:predicted CoA-substrate-specific enzyme activase
MGVAGPFLGIDLGSRTTKIVELEDGLVRRVEILDTTPGSLAEVRRLVSGRAFAASCVTGYGRHLASAHLPGRVVTEITACARGARHLHPGARRVLDIGGQDAKAIGLAPAGGFDRFEMNDRCAAGTGRFLEVMAGLLGFALADFGREALAADRPAAISSMCTVFAESEVVSLVAAGEDRRRIALGLHQSVVDRVWPLVARLEGDGDLFFVGGVAENPAVVRLLEKRFGRPVLVPSRPQIVSALGAALLAAEGEDRP